MRPSTSADSYTPGSFHRIEIESAIPTKCVLPTSLHPLALLCAAELSAGREEKKREKNADRNFLVRRLVRKVCSLHNTLFAVSMAPRSCLCVSYTEESAFSVQHSFLLRGTFAIFCARCSTAADVNELFTSPRVLSFLCSHIKLELARKFSRVLQRESSLLCGSIYGRAQEILRRLSLWWQTDSRVICEWRVEGPNWFREKRSAAECEVDLAF